MVPTVRIFYFPRQVTRYDSFTWASVVTSNRSNAFFFCALLSEAYIFKCCLRGSTPAQLAEHKCSHAFMWMMWYHYRSSGEIVYRISKSFCARYFKMSTIFISLTVLICHTLQKSSNSQLYFSQKLFHLINSSVLVQQIPPVSVGRHA